METETAGPNVGLAKTGAAAGPQHETGPIQRLRRSFPRPKLAIGDKASRLVLILVHD